MLVRFNIIQKVLIAIILNRQTSAKSMLKQVNINLQAQVYFAKNKFRKGMTTLLYTIQRKHYIIIYAMYMCSTQ